VRIHALRRDPRGSGVLRVSLILLVFTWAMVIFLPQLGPSDEWLRKTITHSKYYRRIRRKWKVKNISKIYNPHAPPLERVETLMRCASLWMVRSNWKKALKCSEKAIKVMEKHNLGKNNLKYAEVNLQQAYIHLAHAAWGKAKKPLETARAIVEPTREYVFKSKIYIAFSDLFHMKKRGKTAGRDHEEAKKWRFMADEEERRAEIMWAEQQRKETERLVLAGLMPQGSQYNTPVAGYSPLPTIPAVPQPPMPSPFGAASAAAGMSVATQMTMGGSAAMMGLMPPPGMVYPPPQIQTTKTTPMQQQHHRTGFQGAAAPRESGRQLITGGRVGMGMKTDARRDRSSQADAPEPVRPGQGVPPVHLMPQLGMGHLVPEGASVAPPWVQAMRENQ